MTRPTALLSRYARAALLCAALVLGTSWASSPMVFKHIGAEDGLSQSTVMATVQDARGFIWLATEDGLYRYDGYELRRFGRDRAARDGLASSFIWHIAKDRDGQLWLAVKNGGVARFDPRTERIQTWRHDPADPATLSSDATRTLLVASDGRVWIGTTGGGLNMLDPRSGRITRFRHDPLTPDSLSSDVVTALAEDHNGVIWVGTDNGLNRLTSRSGRFRRFQHDASTPQSLPSDRVSTLHVSRSGGLWVGSFDRGLARFNGDERGFEPFAPGGDGALSSGDVRAILDDGAGQLWVGTANGLNLLDRSSGRFVRYAHDAADVTTLRDSYVMSLHQDRSGLLWVGTRSGGVSRWNPRSWSLGHRRPDALRTAHAMAFAGDAAGRLWIGTHGSGLLRYDPATGALEAAESVLRRRDLLADRRVMSLLKDRRGGLWIGTMNAGLVHVTANGAVRRYRTRTDDASSLGADGIMALLEARDQRIWVGTFGGGIAIIEPDTGRVTRVSHDPRDDASLSSSRATSIAQTPDGTLWVGTDGGGLNALGETGAVLAQWRHDSSNASSLSSNTIYVLHVDPTGTLWIGTDGGGLDRLDGRVSNPDAVTFKNISTEDGLSSNAVYGVLSDEQGSLWLSGNQGLARFEPKSGQIKRFHREHGLQAEEFNFGAFHRLTDGRLVFGGAGGFNLFDPMLVDATQVNAPPLALTRVHRLGSEPLSASALTKLQSLQLNHRDSSVTIEVAALDFTAPTRSLYSYRVRGLSDEWTRPSTQRDITLTNLGAGDYVLEVRAASPDGAWNDAQLQLPLSIAPAPWKSSVALAFYALLALLLAGSWYAAQQRKLRLAIETRARLETEVAQRTSELQQRNAELDRLAKAKGQFVARMSHEIRTPMNGIIGMVQLLRRTRLDDRQQHLARNLATSSDALMLVLNEILDISKVESGKLTLESAPFDLDTLLCEATEVFAAQAQARGLELIIAPATIDGVVLRGDSGRLRQVLMNLIGNAIKFTQQGEIVVGADLGDSAGGRATVTLFVRDTGIGIPQAALTRVFEPFAQAEESTTRRFGGTGLGLSICRELVSLMGGRIQVDSEPGKGSTFSVHLELLRTPSAAARAVLHTKRLRVLSRRASFADAARRLCTRWGIEFEWDPATNWSWGDSDLDSAMLLDVDTAVPNLAALVDHISEHPVRAPLLVAASDSVAATLRDAPYAAQVRVLDKPLRPASVLDAIAGARPAFAAPSPRLATSDESGGARRSGAPRPRVLVAEDHPVNADVIGGMLGLLDCSWEISSRGDDALQRATEQRFDVILMDMNLPELDGPTVTRRIRAAERDGQRTPIIALTAHSDAAHRDACYQAGMDDFLCKPLALEALGEALHRWVPAIPALPSDMSPDTDAPAAAPQAATVAASVSDAISADALARIEALERPGSRGLLERVGRAFVEKSTEQVRVITECYRSGDLATIAGECHLLKASAAYFGATGLSKLAHEIEAACEAGSDGDLGAQIEALRAAQRVTVAELDAALLRRQA
jgi:signal transduction histidine kinase/ligand-binding sensor domain-containing protein/CheY-like chemotaxis protein/HPt (histidine-containing phosphotransfer) domain-containing protein